MGYYVCRSLDFSLHKTRGIARLGEQLLASKEGLCFVELISWESYL